MHEIFLFASANVTSGDFSKKKKYARLQMMLNWSQAKRVETERKTAFMEGALSSQHGTDSNGMNVSLAT